MNETIKETMKTLAEQIVREMEFKNKTFPQSRKFDYGMAEPKIFPYRTEGVVVFADIPTQIENQIESESIHIEYLYQKFSGSWYRISLDEDWLENYRAKVEVCRFFNDRDVVLTAPIGWIRLTEKQKFNYYSSLADVELENYEHTDITETVMKLTVISKAAVEKLNTILYNLPSNRKNNTLF